MRKPCYQTRLADNAERAYFLERLDEAEKAGKRMVGIPEGFARCLPD